MIDWRTLAAQTDAAISAQFGERVRLIPMRGDGYAPRVPDPTRKAITVVLAFDTSGERAMSLMADRAGMPFQTRVALGDMFLWSLSDSYDAVKAFDPQEGDLAEMLDLGETYEINKAIPTATRCVMMSVIRGEK